jgi:hypothetical protein
MKHSIIASLSGLTVSILVFFGAQVALFLPNTLLGAGLAVLAPTAPTVLMVTLLCAADALINAYAMLFAWWVGTAAAQTIYPAMDGASVVRGSLVGIAAVFVACVAWMLSQYPDRSDDAMFLALTMIPAAGWAYWRQSRKQRSVRKPATAVV